MKSRFCSFLLIFFLFSFIQIATAQSVKKGETVQGATGATLDDYLKRVEAFGFSGALIVEKDGKIILSKGYGWADRAKNVKNTTDTPFMLASVSKQFTAAAILQLEEQGKLKTSHAIGKYLKDVPADKSQMTIHQLLTHTWGVGNNFVAGNENNREKADQKILAQPFEAKPGEKFIYSEGYALLGAIVEIVSGQSLESYLKQNIFTPAKMTSAGFMGDAAFYKNKRSRTVITPAMITDRPRRCLIRGMIAGAAESSFPRETSTTGNSLCAATTWFPPMSKAKCSLPNLQSIRERLTVTAGL
jgi:CubicO group peptidase (beta-lactamase class C family)